jgi:hypothetical protein
MSFAAKFWLTWLLILVLGITYAFSHQAQHGGPFTPEEIEWMERQYAHDGTKCCNERDVYVGEVVEWRMRHGHYQVRISGQWENVPPGRLMQHVANDPTPFPGQALLFYSIYPHGHHIWCFFPPPLM